MSLSGVSEHLSENIDYDVSGRVSISRLDGDFEVLMAVRIKMFCYVTRCL